MLSEEVYEYIIANYPPDTDEKDAEVLSTVVNMFFKQFSKDMNECKTKTVPNIKIIYQRLCIIWDITATRLEKEGKPYLKKGGYKSFMESKPEFNEITK